jgi:hypothetical protein
MRGRELGFAPMELAVAFAVLVFTVGCVAFALGDS